MLLLNFMINIINKAVQDAMASRQTNKVLTGTLSAVKNFKSLNGGEVPCAEVFYLNQMEIIIPISQMNVGRASDDEIQQEKIVRTMLGATIDFVVTEINVKTKMAAASRKKAMEIRRMLELPKHKAGDIILARVTGVGLNSAIVEAYGIETKVPKEETDWGYVGNIELQVGQNVPAKIMELDSEKETIKVSIKEAKEDPYREEVNSLSRGESILGEVTGVQEYGVFVRIRSGLNALCPFPNWSNFSPQVGDKYVVKINNINKAERKISANIMRQIFKANR